MKKISLQTKLEDCSVPQKYIDAPNRGSEDIRTIYDLVSLTRREFLRIRSVGPRCHAFWDEFLEQYGLRIGMTVKEILQYEPDGIIQFYLESGKLHSKFISSLNCNPESSIDRSKREKFDPKTLKPHDKVLVRVSNESFNTWYADFVAEPSHVRNETPLILGAKEANMVVPCNDDTKHLVGTNEEAPEFYRYWED